MEPNLRVTISTARNTARDTLSGQTDQITLVDSRKTTCTALASTSGLIRGSTKDNGWTTKCTERERLNGPTAESTWVNLSAIKRRDKVASLGLIIEYTTEHGEMVNSTGKASTQLKIMIPSMAFGRKASVLNGYKKKTDQFFCPNLIYTIYTRIFLK